MGFEVTIMGGEKTSVELKGLTKFLLVRQRQSTSHSIVGEVRKSVINVSYLVVFS